MAAPTLLVGLGGKGSVIVQRVRLLAREHHMEDNLSYVVFDTDVNELNKIRERTPEIEVIQTSTKHTVGQYLEIDTRARDVWFPVNDILNRKALSEGAGQVRAISRLALNSTIKAGRMNPLHQAIERLYKLSGENTAQALRVILVGSLCGGTGSGLILPVSMYIRNYLVTRFQQNSAIIRGFFLLPEVFYPVISGQSERNNLKANAYAALRELDAFLMKGDGSLAKQYDLHLMLPRAGSDEMEEYDVSPMDFCFLYDAQNMDGSKQNNFEDYLDHAASCIYAQSIAPTSSRSNSSEDNVIRDLCSAGGRNRYCGAGSSMIVYPVADVKEYLALSWLRENVSSEWLKIDTQYKQDRASYQKARRRGLNPVKLERSRHYIDTVEQQARNHSGFENIVQAQCTKFDETGVIKVKMLWEEYIEKLMAHVRTSVSSSRQDVEQMRTECEQMGTTAKDSGKGDENPVQQYKNWLAKLQQYRAGAIRATQETAQTIAYSLFRDDEDHTATSDTFRMEYWLHRDGTADIMHPNAMRYFLYSLSVDLGKKIGAVEKIVRGEEQAFEDFDTAFDDPNTENIVETPGEFIDKHLAFSGMLQKLLHHGDIREGKSTLDSQFDLLTENITAYRTNYVMLQVLTEAQRYANELSGALERFYSILERKIGDIGPELDRLERKYESQEGKPTRYVCASKKCLKGLRQEAVFMQDSMELPGMLTALIFNRCKKYALMETKPSRDDFFLSIYDDGTDGMPASEDEEPEITSVMAYWRSAVMADYGSVVDMNVLDAMAAEARYEQAGDTYDDAAVELYMARIIDSANILSRPFIESPMGMEPRVIPSCCYSDELEKRAEPARLDFINTHLKNNGGVSDASIDPHIIIFYQAIYALRANDLSKFAPPSKTATYSRPGGEYYTAYFELIGKLYPDTTKTKSITPHIDKRWHVITALPDLDEGNQLRQEETIQAALFWGLITGMVELTRDRNQQEIYNLRFGSVKDEMVVSNGSKCDNLYEVLDSLTITPMNVTRIHQQVSNIIARERNLRKPVHVSLLRKSLDKFKVPEFPYPDGTVPVRTIFEIPMLMQRSKPADDYDLEEMCRLMQTIFREIRQYLSGFFREDELDSYYGNLIYRQFMTFLDDLVQEKKLSEEDPGRDSEELPVWYDVYNDDLFRSLVQMTREELENAFMSDEADKIEEAAQRDELKN